MRKWYSFMLAFGLALAVLAGCGTDTSSSQAEGEQTEAVEEVSATVILSKQNGEEKMAEEEVTVEAGTTLMEVMKSNFEVEESGGFINGLEGISMNEEEKMAWIYTINGEEAMVGAAEYEIEQGDEIVFDYQSWE
ncbi:DUF4430 domain-containing protein [Halobacillus salinus]|uniref:DUF4430 domain-containing protein n=1 Tax=Halobacillus salinus TaxID=192814 RepID=A0A4Z0H3Y9_9BACI|nr:DUF4430 domain-containing protein [Halobacillus salinus]TGB04489.1 DUF4430 domain-containing protein [Halobacillus salinus]